MRKSQQTRAKYELNYLFIRSTTNRIQQTRHFYMNAVGHFVRVLPEQINNKKTFTNITRNTLRIDYTCMRVHIPICCKYKLINVKLFDDSRNIQKNGGTYIDMPFCFILDYIIYTYESSREANDICDILRCDRHRSIIEHNKTSEIYIYKMGIIYSTTMYSSVPMLNFV